MKAKKSLGQNFLKNDSVLEDIAELADISEETTVLEIGPGHGELTGFLVKKNPKRIIVIEKDEVLAIGDGLNDLPLFEAAGTKVAMGNAYDELKALADDITLDVENGGVAAAIGKYLL